MPRRSKSDRRYVLAISRGQVAELIDSEFHTMVDRLRPYVGNLTEKDWPIIRKWTQESIETIDRLHVAMIVKAK